MRLVLVEHMEEAVTRWVLEEYKEAERVAREAGFRLVVAGVGNPLHRAQLQAHGLEVWERHSWEVCDYPKAIVLDMWTSRDLQPWEAEVAECFIVGGIMGDHPPRRRGLMLTRHFDWAATRRLGPGQLSVDGTVKVLVQVAGGRRLEELEMAESPTIEVETPLGRIEVTLPFTYPTRGGRPWISRGLARLLASGVVWDED
ncbi:MAG: hypothetical protein GSR84_07275 [Desulfurococcales archaeon]|nr:hypothetical protein [Desulfurococcales archaeon]